MTVIWWFNKEPSHFLDMTYIDGTTSDFIKYCLLMLQEYRHMRESWTAWKEEWWIKVRDNGERYKAFRA